MDVLLVPLILKEASGKGTPMSPLLFVLCMDYFSRIMAYIGKQPEFGFHPRCKSLDINNLCFANDVMLFCKGIFKIISMLL